MLSALRFYWILNRHDLDLLFCDLSMVDTLELLIFCLFFPAFFQELGLKLLRYYLGLLLLGVFAGLPVVFDWSQLHKRITIVP